MSKNFFDLEQADESGFSLVELMVVVAIIGILAAVAVPRFSTFKAIAGQTEAKSALSGVFLAIQAYQSNYNQLPATTAPAAGNLDSGGAAAAAIGFATSGAAPKYSLNIGIDAAANSWAAGAVSLVPVAGTKYDVWRINANRWLCSPYNAPVATAAVATPAATSATAVTDCPETTAGAAGYVVTLVAADVIQ